ncbi:carbohydrate ABC transporter substrate-binding protein [Paenibacillus mesophilus]|uniref:ABC transporter substrate-binding protein n=1 Tax=Paenibacillus mesophilus TaxID=2582849 RepID=UPI00110E010C|nr:ABC transporter substrate-binding protein [Paenibacillus mesophilus]TMV50051.1 carbohydrate ABC transporter substrate-binding protein [Paenibacillus mesophilus]
MKKNRWCRALGIGAAVWLALTGCQSKTAQTTAPPQENAKKVVRIMYFSEQQFMKEYGDSFKSHYPNVEIQIIPMMLFSGGKTTNVTDSAILEQKPDLVYGSGIIRELNKTGKLIELTHLMKQDRIEQSQFSASALEVIRNLGDGKLVALSPTFQTVALYYNKDLFDRLRIAYPSNDMSWSGMLQLSKTIAKADNKERPLFGLDLDHYLPHRFFIDRYVDGVGISAYSDDMREVKYTSEAYRSAFEEVIGAFGSAIYLPPEKREPSKSKAESLLKSKFIAGEAAMAIAPPSLILSLKEAASLGIPSFSWDIVTAPSHPQKPGQSSDVFAADLFAIMSDSPNKEAAWEFLKYITGPAMAAELERTKPKTLSIRLDAAKTMDGRKLDPFYALRPIPFGQSPFTQQLYEQILSIRTEELTDMIYGRKRIAGGLKSMQTRVQLALDREFGGKTEK